MAEEASLDEGRKPRIACLLSLPEDDLLYNILTLAGISYTHLSMRKALGIVGLLVFVTGTLLVPALHRLELACADDGAAEDVCHSYCSQEDSRKHANVTETPERSHDSRPHRKPHDPLTCSICQLAKTPVSTAVVAIALPQFDLIDTALPSAPRPPDFKTPRLLPFSCGPPA